MADHERKATIHWADNDFFVGITHYGKAKTMETDYH